ncbi:MAG: hypothetical protein AB7S26_14085 [Sandaracinaceae bacterium]
MPSERCPLPLVRSTIASSLLIATACAGSPARSAPHLVERVRDCVWFDETETAHHGPSPVAAIAPRECERATVRLEWQGCVHVDVARRACLNGCSECLAHVVGDDSSTPAASRADRCWGGPDPGCAVAFDICPGWMGSAGRTRVDAPDYDCAVVHGRCASVPSASSPVPADAHAVLPHHHTQASFTR